MSGGRDRDERQQTIGCQIIGEPEWVACGEPLGRAASRAASQPAGVASLEPPKAGQSNKQTDALFELASWRLICSQQQKLLRNMSAERTPSPRLRAARMMIEPPPPPLLGRRFTSCDGLRRVAAAEADWSEAECQSRAGSLAQATSAPVGRSNSRVFIINYSSRSSSGRPSVCFGCARASERANLQPSQPPAEQRSAARWNSSSARENEKS